MQIILSKRTVWFAFVRFNSKHWFWMISKLASFEITTKHNFAEVGYISVWSLTQKIKHSRWCHWALRHERVGQYSDILLLCGHHFYLLTMASSIGYHLFHRWRWLSHFISGLNSSPDIGMFIKFPLNGKNTKSFDIGIFFDICEIMIFFQM